MSSSLAARVTRMAISDRLATRIFETGKALPPGLGGLLGSPVGSVAAFRAAAAAQAPEEAGPGAARHGDRQDRIIRRGEEGDHARGTARRALPDGPSIASKRCSTTGWKTHISQSADEN